MKTNLLYVATTESFLSLTFRETYSSRDLRYSNEKRKNEKGTRLLFISALHNQQKSIQIEWSPSRGSVF